MFLRVKNINIRSCKKKIQQAKKLLKDILSMNDSVLKKKKKGNPHIFPLWFIKWENKRAPKKESILLYWSSATKVIIEVYEAGFNSMK